MIKLFGDKIIWSICIVLFIASVLLIYSSGGYTSLSSHITHVFLGLGLVYIFSRFNYRYFNNLSTLLLGVSIIMLVWLIVSPSSYRGEVFASRWIKLGFMSFQPSELAKYSLILFLCRNLVLYKDKLYSFTLFFKHILLPSIIVGFLIIQSNLSTVVLIIILLVLLVFMSGYSISYFFKYMIFPFILISTIFFSFFILPPIKIIDTTFPRLTTWKNRICAKELNFMPLVWIDCSSYDHSKKYDNNYQVNNALSAINRGGVLGSGAGKSYYKRILPDSKSDFIFAILLEEYGLGGGVIVLFLYLLFYQRILILSIHSKEEFARLLLLGLGSMIVFQAFLHMLVSVNLIPVTGQTLPLISKGGSSVWVTSLAVGIILNISHQIKYQNNLHE